MLTKSRTQMQKDAGLEASKYPALVHVWGVDTIDGSVLRDPIGRADITYNADFSITDGMILTKAGGSMKGYVQPPGTKDVIMFAVGKIASSKLFELGAPSINNGFGFGTSTSYTVTSDGDYTTNTAQSGDGSNVRVMGLQIDWGTGNGEVRGFVTDSSTGEMTLSAPYAITTVGDGSLNDGLSAFTTNNVGISASVDLYNFYVFYTSALPSATELATAIEWMHDNPDKGLHSLFETLPA